MTSTRADEAARSVLTLFGVRALGLPYVRLGRVSRPGPRPKEWHYWWQAHLIDCLIDAARRGSPHSSMGLVRRHLAGVWLRNGLRWRNDYFDDMAWLALAAQRAGRTPRRLLGVLRGAVTSDGGGGAFWSSTRDFKNTAASGPIALVLARDGDLDTAADLLDWLTRTLADPDHGLFRDGVRWVNDEPTMVPYVFTYNQGPALGAMLELGTDAHLAAAEAHVAAVRARLTRGGHHVLTSHGAGDGGLFTGILTRYLALAALDTRLSRGTRDEAAAMVLATADNLWDARVERGWRHHPVTLFPQDTTLPGEIGPVSDGVELATQLQAWMALESAASLR